MVNDKNVTMKATRPLTDEEKVRAVRNAKQRAYYAKHKEKVAESRLRSDLKRYDQLVAAGVIKQ